MGELLRRENGMIVSSSLLTRGFQKKVITFEKTLQNATEFQMDHEQNILVPTLQPGLVQA